MKQYFRSQYTAFSIGDRTIVTSLFILLIISGCKKFVQVAPPATSISGTTVFSSNTSAEAAMTGIYDNMMSNGSLSQGSSSISYLGGALADELQDYSSSAQPLGQFYTNSLASSTNGSSNLYFWPEIYMEIHNANAVLEGVAKASGATISAAVKQQLTGEAKFMRAFLLFYAVNLYGDVPLVTTTDYLTNNSIHRSPAAQVYQQIIQDLKDAQLALSDKFVDQAGNSTVERIRPNKGAATALLARVYLYNGNWDSAEAQATNLINNTTQYKLVANLTSVFLANSQEAIWQFQPVVRPTYNTLDAYYFILTGAPGSGHSNVAISRSLMGSFEPGDKRIPGWVDSIKVSSTMYYYPYKYKVGQNQPLTEYLMVFRFSEQYLIRAEARAQQGNTTGSASDLNAIRARAGLTVTSATDKQSLLTAIMHERQVELFTEWGHRWFDLKRTSALNSTMGSPGNICQAKGGVWNPNAALLPIPLSETQINPNLSQNPGY